MGYVWLKYGIIYVRQRRYYIIFSVPYCYSILLLQTLTVVILVPLQMVVGFLSAQSTQVKYSTPVIRAIHYRDQTEERARVMESGVDIYHSVMVCF